MSLPIDYGITYSSAREILISLNISSLQDTVLAMQALAVFSAIVHGGKEDLTVDVAVPGLSHRFTVNNDNKLVLQRIEVSCHFELIASIHLR